MIWHIFRKDCRALSRGIWAVALINAISTAMWIGLGPLAGGTQMYVNALAISVLALSCMLLLIAAAVLQDAPSVSEQDWRVRPIKRRDLIAAKLLFAILAVHAPLLVLDFVGGVAQGFGALPSAGAAAARGTALFLSLTVPAIVLATLESDLIGWIRLTVGVALLLFVFGSGIEQLMPSRPHYTGTGLAWIPAFANFILIILAASIILPLRYRARRRGGAAIIAVSAVMLSVVSAVLPWDVFFSIQRAFASAAMPDEAATFSFDPSARPAPQQFSSMGVTRAHIPLHVSSIPRDAMLLIENAAVRILDAQGSIIYAGDNNCVRPNVFTGLDCTAGNFRVRTQDASGEARFYYPVGLPDPIYQRVRNEALRVELDYYVSLLVVDDVSVVGAEGSRTPWCAMRRDLDRFMSRCLNTAAVPACTRIVGQHRRGWDVVPERERCRPNYAPVRFNRLPDVVRRFDDEDVWFPDTGHAATDATFSKASNLLVDQPVTLETYRAQSHFKRSIVIESVRLGAWGG